MVWGWVLSSIMNLIVSLCLAEICGIFPSTGSVYDWTNKLSPPNYSPLLSYWTGNQKNIFVFHHWFNLFKKNFLFSGLFSWLGNASGNATTALYVTTTFNSILSNLELSPINSLQEVILSILLITIWSLLNFLGVEKLGWISNLSALSLVLCIFVICLSLIYSAPKLQNSSFVFFQYENDTGYQSSLYVLSLSLLLPLFSFSGYEAASLVAEETKNASIASPLGIISSVIASAIGGFIFLLSLLYSIQNVDPLIKDQNNSSISILFDQCMSKNTSNILLFLLMFNTFLCGLCNSTLSARITYALGRDNMIPFSSFVSEINSSNRSPINAIIFVYVFNICLLLLPLTSAGYSAFSNIASICTLGYQFSYAIPILCKSLFTNDRDFKKSYIYLGCFSNFLCMLSFIWLSSTSILFLLPNQYPINYSNMNYSIFYLLAFFLIALIFWITRSNKYSRDDKDYSLQQNDF